MKTLKVILLGIISTLLLTIGLSTATAKLDPVQNEKNFKTTISEIPFSPEIYPEDPWGDG